jgi:hypothetical protein
MLWRAFKKAFVAAWACAAWYWSCWAICFAAATPAASMAKICSGVWYGPVP